MNSPARLGLARKLEIWATDPTELPGVRVQVIPVRNEFPVRSRVKSLSREPEGCPHDLPPFYEEDTHSVERFCRRDGGVFEISGTAHLAERERRTARGCGLTPVLSCGGLSWAGAVFLTLRYLMLGYNPTIGRPRRLQHVVR